MANEICIVSIGPRRSQQSTAEPHSNDRNNELSVVVFTNGAVRAIHTDVNSATRTVGVVVRALYDTLIQLGAQFTIWALPRSPDVMYHPDNDKSIPASVTTIGNKHDYTYMCAF